MAPYEVVAASGTSADLVHLTTKEPRSRVHSENLIYLRTDIADYERRRALRAPESIVPVASSTDERRTLGQLVSERSLPAPPRAVDPDSASKARARLKGVAEGRYVAYRGELPRRCRVGRALRVDNDARLLSVHVHGAEADSRLRVRWSPLSDPDESGTPSAQG